MGLSKSTAKRLYKTLWSDRLESAARKQPLRPGSARVGAGVGIVAALVFAGWGTSRYVGYREHQGELKHHRHFNERELGKLAVGGKDFVGRKAAVRTDIAYVATRGAKLYYSAEPGADVYRKVPLGADLFAFMGQRLVDDNKHTWVSVVDGSTDTAQDRVNNTYWLDVTAGQKNNTIHALLPYGKGAPSAGVAITLQQNGTIIDSGLPGAPINTAAGTGLWLDHIAGDHLIQGLHVTAVPPVN